jgi:hypothetical protein
LSTRSRARELAAFTGGNFLIPCTELFARGAEIVTVVGPLLLDEAREVHRGSYSIDGDVNSRSPAYRRSRSSSVGAVPRMFLRP